MAVARKVASREKEYVVKIVRDDEAGVWIALSDDIPGLVLEAVTYEQLISEIRGAAPALIEDNILGKDTETSRRRGYSLRYVSDVDKRERFIRPLLGEC